MNDALWTKAASATQLDWHSKSFHADTLELYGLMIIVILLRELKSDKLAYCIAQFPSEVLVEVDGDVAVPLAGLAPPVAVPLYFSFCNCRASDRALAWPQCAKQSYPQLLMPLLDMSDREPNRDEHCYCNLFLQSQSRLLWLWLEGLLMSEGKKRASASLCQQTWRDVDRKRKRMQAHSFAKMQR